MSPTFAPVVARVDDRGFGSSRQGADVIGMWVHHQGDGAGADAIGYMAGPNDRDSHPTYGIDDDVAATVVGIVHPNRAPSSTFYVNDQYAVAIEAANTTGAPEWRTPDATLEKIARIAAHHAIESPRAGYPIEANRPGVAQRGFFVGWHAQVGSTACPGPWLISKIPWIVARANQIKDAIQSGRPIPTEGDDFMSALTDAQQLELVKKTNSMDYAIGGILMPAVARMEVKLAQLQAAAGQSVDVAALAKVIVGQLQPALEAAVGEADDIDSAAVATKVANELAKRLVA